MSALGSLVVKLALDYAEYTQGLDRSSQEALKFAKGAQTSFDQAGRSAKEFMGNVAGNVAGAVASVVGLNAAFTRVRDSINVLESLDDAAQKTGSSVEDLSRIAKVAKNFGDAFAPIEQGITRLAKGLAQIDNPSSDAIRALNAIGVSARDSTGQLRTAADVYIDVARSLQQYKDGAEKTAVATALFGKSGAELLPMLNNLAGGIDSVKAVSAASAQQASMFNDAVAKSKASVNGLFMSLAVDLLPTLNNIVGAFNQSTGQVGGFSIASESAKIVLKGLAIAVYAVVEGVSELGRGLAARAAQLSSLASMDLNGVKVIGKAYAEDNARSRAEFKRFVETVLDGEKKISAAVGTGEKKLINFQTQIPSAVDSATRSIEKQTKAFDMELHKLKEYDKEASRARDITQSVATKQEIYNQALAELNRLKPYLSIETYNRALEKAQKTLNDTGAVNRSVVSEMDQLWMQAGRNIQSTLANSIFDFFNGGLDDMWRNAKVAVGRILSEFAALKLAQSIGLTAMFAVPGSAAASGGSGGAVPGASAWDIASLGTSALNLFKGGFGVPGFIGNMGSSLPGAAGSFFTGMAGKGATQLAAEAGAMSLWGASGATTSIAASMGSAFAAAAGPMMAAYMATQLFRGLAGDRRVGGGFGKFINKIGDIPILGDLMPGIPLLNALFGRGPLKQKETTLTGFLGLEGFESGMLQTRFKASGSVFRGSKTDFARIDAITGEIWTDNQKQLREFAQGLSKAAKEVFGAFNDAAKSASAALNQTAGNLGLSADALQDFSYELNIVSEKGKGLTEEQVGQEIENLTDAMARKLLPQIDDLAKRGETALQTVSRLGTEFTTLVDAATIVLGKSAADARAMILGATFEGRTGFVDAAGGTDALSQMAQYFAANFLTDAERLAPKQEALNTELNNLGLSVDLTRDQFRDLAQSFGEVGGVSEEVMLSLLKLAPEFINVRNAQDALAESARNTAQINEEGVKALMQNAITTRQATLAAQRAELRAGMDDAFRSLQRAVDEERKSVGKHIDDIAKSIDRLKNLSGSLQSALGRMQISGNQAADRVAAQAQITTALTIAKASGTLPDAQSLSRALDVVAQPSEALFGSFVDYARDFARTAADISELDRMAQDQLGAQDAALGLEQSQLTALDNILIAAQQEIDAINGVNTTIASLASAISGFAAATAAVRQIEQDIKVAPAGLDSAVLGSAGNAAISGRDIALYINTSGATPDQILAKALETGVSAQQVVDAMGGMQGYTLDNIRGFVQQKGLIPGFADGGFHRGGLRIVGETGPEIEYTGPSRIFSNAQSRELLDLSAVIAELKSLRTELAEIKASTSASAASNARTAELLDDVSAGGGPLLVTQVP